MVCHEFKGGIGTSSRVLDEEHGGFTVAALVQANYGKRAWLRVDGVPVGDEIGTDEVPSPYDQADAIDRREAAPGPGSIDRRRLATDAPLLPHQCERLAQRAGLGIARAGGTGGHTSGDLFIAFATGNRIPAEIDGRSKTVTYDVKAVGDKVIDQLFDGAIEVDRGGHRQRPGGRADDVGRDGITAHACRTTACSRS